MRRAVEWAPVRAMAADGVKQTSCQAIWLSALLIGVSPAGVAVWRWAVR